MSVDADDPCVTFLAMPPGADHRPELERPGFAEVLRARRREVGLTQQELADRANLGVRTVRELEKGRATRPQRNTIDLLADALGLNGSARAQFQWAARGGVADLGAVEPGEPAAPGTT